jgi:hypothetical protein
MTMNIKDIALLTGGIAVGAGLATLLNREADEFSQIETKEGGIRANVLSDLPPRDPAMKPPACKDDSPGGNVDTRYNLPGAPAEPGLPAIPQVEPESGYWTETAPGRELIHIVDVDQVIALTRNPIQDGKENPYYVPPYPKNKAFLDWEIAELNYLEGLRNNYGDIDGNFPTTPPALPVNQKLPAEFTDTTRLPLSDFILLHSPPFGAIFNIEERYQYLVQNVNQQHLRRDIPRYTPQTNFNDPTSLVLKGRELARMFEEETPGLLHRHALNYLLYRRGDISPVRQARIWMALDVAIYSALIAAWHFKWALSPNDFSYRQRPYEYDRNKTFRILFDDTVDDVGQFNGNPRTRPCPSPGTPRHPAYPSGHSTYSAAASRILEYFFPEEREHFRRLANNIGMARLWAGVHWRSDHVAGKRIGEAVAQLLINQLQGDCVPTLQQNIELYLNPPMPDELKRRATDRRKMAHCDANQDKLPTQRSGPIKLLENETAPF